MTHSNDDRILVLAPTGRDAALTCSLLAKAELFAVSVPDVGSLCTEMEKGAAVVLIAEEVLVPLAIARLATQLGRQEPWSDLPIILFSGEGATVQARIPTLKVLEPLGNVTLLDRPVRPTTMLSATRAALRGRCRQYDVRKALLAEREAVRERDRFLAMLGHELRNPLSPILLSLGMMDRRPPGSDNSKQIGVIRRQVHHLARLVDDLLDVSRVTSGKIVIRRAPTELFQLIRRCRDSLEGLVQAQHLSFSLTGGIRPTFVSGDAVRLEQVVMNLAMNAIKYTPAGGRIDIALEDEGGFAILRFRDDGIGIHPEVLPNVFNLFVQAEQSLDRSKGGMGVGLTLVRSIVELHGGTVRANSGGQGKGSEFVVRLPMCEDPDAFEHLERPVQARKTPLVAHDVLIIEDNEDSRETLKIVLEARGHRVDTAEDGSVGVARAIERRPDVLFVDIGLPEMDGYSVARAIREALGREPYLVALTGYGQPSDQKLALDAGFDLHLTKPVTVERIDQILAQPKRRNVSDSRLESSSRASEMGLNRSVA